MEPSRGDAPGVNVVSNFNYIKGRNLEYSIMGRLRRAGYFVLRASGSHGPMDLIALKARPPTALFIQAKRSKAVPSPASWNLLFDLAESFKAVPVLASRTGPIGTRALTYWQIMARREARERSGGLMQRYDPFGQSEMF